MTSELTKAHCKFIQQIGTIEEKGTNPFHKSQYATLEGVLSVVNPVLAANGLVVSQTFDHEDGRPILKTHLRHISGEELTSSALYPETVGKNKLHDWGGNCTYMRRYTLLAMLGICAGIEDTDGNHAQQESLRRGRNDNWLKTPSTVIPKTQVNTPTNEKQDIPKPASKEEIELMKHQLVEMYSNDTQTFQKLETAYRAEFKNVDKFSDHIQEPKHIRFIGDWVKAYKKN